MVHESDGFLRSWSRELNMPPATSSFAIDSMGAANSACVGDGLVGEGGGFMRSSVKRKTRTETRMSDGQLEST